MNLSDAMTSIAEEDFHIKSKPNVNYDGSMPNLLRLKWEIMSFTYNVNSMG